jgi:hypothetical protein
VGEGTASRVKLFSQIPVRFLMFWILSGVLEFPFFIGFVYDPSFLINHQWTSLALHGVACITIFFCQPRGKGWWHADRLWARNFMLLLAFSSLFGWLASGMLYFFHWRKPYKSMAEVEAEMDFLAARETVPLMVKHQEDKHTRISKEFDFMPLSDILASDDFSLRRGAIEKLAKLKTPAAIMLLESYRSDPSMDIRFLITTALSNIKKEFEEQLHAAKETLKKDTYKLESRIYLARIYLQYSRSGLLNAIIAKSYVEEALYHLQFSIMDEEAPVEVFWLLIEIYEAREDWEKVLQVIDVLRKREKADLPDMARSQTNALYSLGRFDELVTAFVDVRKKGQLSPQMNAIADWWLG